MFKRFRSSKSNSKDATDRRPSDPSAPNASIVSTTSTFDLARGRSRDLLDVSRTAESRLQSRSPSPTPSGLGLHIIHHPEFFTLDIVFVHGLGGHSQRTWSKHHDASLFWPQLWLPFEPDVGTTRILTFGYNANWRGSTKGVANISDFAKELLFEMRFAKDENGLDLGIGEKPVIFVVHSMGGLVVKKAFLLGIHDETYKDIVKSISAIIFLSTPHRGTNLAETLNRVLAASFQTPKSFISDLTKNSAAIEELNEQFRHLAPKLSIWSFYETLATAIGPKKIMVLEKESAVLGYPTEISRPLQADHHDVCKYSSPTDSNYISVRNAIKSLVARFRSNTGHAEGKDTETSFSDVQNLFRNCVTSEDDYNTLRRHWIPDTCGWFLREPQFVSWFGSSREPHVLWYNAPPGNGKSILSAFVIDHIRRSGHLCQYFIFKYSDQSKRSVSQSLRALAYQLARDIPDFRRLLSGSSPESLGLESTDPALIWNVVFEKTFFGTGISKPVYWVIDGLDECDSPRSFLENLKGLSKVKLPIKILIFSRNTDSISMGFDRLSQGVPVGRIEKTGEEHNQNDIELFVGREIQHMRGGDRFKQELLKNLTGRAKGNFLWTRLVLDEIMGCHTEESIQEVLEEVPDDMTRLYQRMEQSLLATTRKSNKPLIQALLEWSTCAQRSLSITELSHALSPGFSGFLDLARTIKETCGQFIQVGNDGMVRILHHTAREYFTRSPDSELYIDPRKTHGKLFGKSLAVLEEDELRWRLMQSQHALQASEPFVFYAAVNWSYHLGHSHSNSSDHLDLLVKFFRSPAVLAWIHVLALLRRVEVLVKTSKVLASFTRNTRKRNASRNPMLHRLSDLDFLDDWVVDLIKLAGKFGRILVSEPGAIYDIIPAFCPKKSAVHGQYYRQDAAKVKVVNSDDSSWNDHLGRFALPNDVQAWSISCAGRYIAVLASTSNVHVCDSSSFVEVCIISHGEAVTATALNKKGSKLVTYGLKTTKLWGLPSGASLSSTTNPPYTKAMTLALSDNDQKLLVGGDDNLIRTIRFDALDEGWKILNEALLKDTARIEGAVVNSPMCLAFNGDTTQVGVSYRGAPLSIWRLSDGRCINRCRRAKEFRNDQRRPSSNWFAVDRFAWNNVTGHILGIYKDGCIFKWHPITDENIEAQWSADEITASANGKLFATSSSNGSVRIWNFSYFTVIYQLSSEDLVTGLSFSPDSRAFYDLRGGNLNAWEPNALTRLSEGDEHVSDTNSEDQSSTAFSKFSEDWITHFEAVTAFDLSPDGFSYCVGYEDGSARLFRKGDSAGIELAHFYNFLNVTHIRWSKNTEYVAVADLAGDVQVKAIKHEESKELDIIAMPKPRIQLDGNNIRDVIFSHDCQFLFILTDKNGYLCSIQDGTLQATTDLENGNARKWMCHPNHSNLLLGYGATDVQAYSWSPLELIGSSPYRVSESKQQLRDRLPDAGATAGIMKVADISLADDVNCSPDLTRAMLTQDGRHVLITIQTTGTGGKSQQTVLLELPCLDPGDEQVLPNFLDAVRIPPLISAQINVPLGLLPGSTLAFLNQDLWLCSYPLNSGFLGDIPETCQRHYFIPRDWVGAISLSSCALTADGALFWPRDDKVICIECNLEDSPLGSVY